MSEQTFFDQSFSVTKTNTAARLREVELLVAKFACSMAKRQGELTVVPSSSPKDQTALFPHGRIDYKAGKFDKSSKPVLTADSVSPHFPAAVKDNDDIVIVEASEDIVLTPKEDDSTRGRYKVSEDAHLIVFGDVVCIEGRIRTNGKHIFIFARELRTQSKDGQTAELNTTPKEPTIYPVPSFQSTAGSGGKGKVAVHHKRWRDGWSGGPLTAIDGDPDDELAGRGETGTRGQDGERGKTGEPGGDIYVFCHTIQPPFNLTLNASGANGYPGGNGQEGGKGGDGGDGLNAKDGRHGNEHNNFFYCAALPGGAAGDGGPGGNAGPGGTGGATGNVSVIVNEKLEANVKIENTSKPGEAGAVGKPGKGGAAGDKPGNNGGYPQLAWPWFAGKMQRVENALRNPGHSDNNDRALVNALQYYRSKAGPNVTPAPGKGGDPNSASLPAKMGRSLIVDNIGAKGTEEKASPLAELEGLARVSHLQKLLETTRGRYMEWDAYRFARDTTAGTLKAKLLDNLRFLMLGKSLLLSVANKAFSGTLSKAVATLTERAAGDKDYFGNADNVVPLGPPKYHLKTFSEALDRLKTREDRFVSYTTQLKDKVTLANQRRLAVDDADSHIGVLAKEAGGVAGRLTALATKTLPDNETDRQAAMKELKTALTAFTHEVETCFGLTPEQLIDCVFNLAFAGSPVQEGSGGVELSKHGLFTGLTTIGSQVGKLVNTAINTLPNDEGQPVNRKHVVKKIERFTEKLDTLKEAFEVIKDAHNPGNPDSIAVEDEDAYRLLVSQRDFEQMLDQFSNMRVARDAIEKLDAYVAVVQERNATIAEYNQLAGKYLSLKADIEAATAQRKTVDELRSSSAQPNLESETAFMAALYNRAREECIQYCYLASRSYQFWTLGPDTSLYSTLKLGARHEVNHNLLSEAKDQIFVKSIADIQKQFSKPAASFPNKDVRRGIHLRLAASNGYELVREVVDSPKKLSTGLRRAVQVALIGTRMHVRIVNGAGKVVGDKPEEEMPREARERFRKLAGASMQGEMSTADLSARDKRRVRDMTGNHPNTVRMVLPVPDLMPTGGRNLIALGFLDSSCGLLIRGFDSAGQMYLDDNDLQPTTVRPLAGAWKTRFVGEPKPGEHFRFPSQSDTDRILSLVREVLPGYPDAHRSRLAVGIADRFSDLGFRFSDEGVTWPHVVFVEVAGFTTQVRTFDGTGRMSGKFMEGDKRSPAGAKLRAAVEEVYGSFFLSDPDKLDLVKTIDQAVELPFRTKVNVADSVDELPEAGVDLIGIAEVEGKLMFRVFDGNGQRVIDVPENDSTHAGKVRALRTIFRKPFDAHVAAMGGVFPRSTVHEERRMKIITAAGELCGHPMPPSFPKELEQLKRTGSARFVIMPPSPGSETDSDPFHRFYNVRLSRVRVWAPGVQTGDGKCVIKLAHKGKEVICRAAGAPAAFEHEGFETEFSYDHTLVERHAVNGEITNADAVILEERQSPLSVSIEKEDEQLAMIGPFAEWTITIADEDHTDLDRDEIECIYLDFHGVGLVRSSSGTGNN